MLRTVLAACCTLFLFACATPSGPVYNEKEAGTVWRAEEGAVASIRSVTIQGDATALGTVGGAAIGYTLGRAVGEGSGSRIAGAVGGVAGTVAGRAAESQARSKPGLELTVSLDSGETVVVVQPADTRFSIGQRVRVLFGNANKARVNPL